MSYTNSFFKKLNFRMGFDQEALGEYNQRFNNQLNEFKSGPN